MRARRWSRRLAALVAVPAVLAGTVVAGAPASGVTSGIAYIQTEPALAGVHLTVGSIAVTTGPNGSASVAVGDLNRIATSVFLNSTALDSRNSISLAYVKPALHLSKYQSHLTVGLDVTSRVTLRISGGTTGVAPGQINAIRLHSVTGQTILINPQRSLTVNLLSRKARRIRGVGTSQVVTWSVDSLRSGPGVAITTPKAKFDPFSSSVWPMLLRPVTGTVVVDTFPATPGVSFLLEGASFSTDAKGHAAVPVADLNNVDNRLGLSTDQATGSTVSLLRVYRGRPRPFQRHLLAALAVNRPVSLSFAYPNGREFPADRVTNVELVGGGNTVIVPGTQLNEPVSVLSEQTKLVAGSLTPQQVVYAVARVTIDGADAVFAGQQRFNPVKESHWPISVSVFDVRVTVGDVLFGHPVTSDAVVTPPDGVRYVVKLRGSEPTLLRSLARGQYTVTTASAVYGASSKLLVDKNSDVELRIVTLPDVFFILLLALGMSASVVMLGRRWARSHQ